VQAAITPSAFRIDPTLSRLPYLLKFLDYCTHEFLLWHLDHNMYLNARFGEETLRTSVLPHTDFRYEHVSMNLAVFWIVTSCTLLYRYQRFGVDHCLRCHIIPKTDCYPGIYSSIIFQTTDIFIITAMITVTL
jgi:hypothetical protein